MASCRRGCRARARGAAAHRARDGGEREERVDGLREGAAAAGQAAPPWLDRIDRAGPRGVRRAREGGGASASPGCRAIASTRPTSRWPSRGASASTTTRGSPRRALSRRSSRTRARRGAAGVRLDALGGMSIPSKADHVSMNLAKIPFARRLRARRAQAPAAADIRLRLGRRGGQRSRSRDNRAAFERVRLRAARAGRRLEAHHRDRALRRRILGALRHRADGHLRALGLSRRPRAGARPRRRRTSR